MSAGIGHDHRITPTLIIPLITISTLNYRLLLVPLIFLVTLTLALRYHNNNLRPVAGQLRERFGTMNAGLAETVSGVEVVKGFAQERAEEDRFRRNARSYRDAFVREGDVTARYLPLLLYGICLGLAFWTRAPFSSREGTITVGQAITFMALFGTLRSPVRFLLNTLSVVQQSLASARRILDMILTETELDQNQAGINKAMQGDIVFRRGQLCLW